MRYLILALLLLAARAEAQPMKPPRLVTFVEAEYPADKKASGITGEVKLHITVGVDGHVEQVTVAESGGADFDAAALAAAQRFVFEPAEVNGKPARVKITYVYKFTITPAAPVVTVIEGTVRLRGRPARAMVRVGDKVVTTEGRFVFEGLPPGKYTVEVAGIGALPFKSEEETREGTKKIVTYDLEPEPPPPPPPTQEPVEEVRVRGPRPQREAAEVTIASEQGRRVAGTQGDVLKVVQVLPGVARPAFGSGQIVVWGSAPKETKIYVDGVEIPQLYHGSAIRSVIHNDLVKSIQLVPGAFSAEYGRGLGGILRVETRRIPDGTHAQIAVDTLDAGALVSSQIGSRLRVAAAGRYGWVDRLLPLVTKRDIGEYFTIPRYRDYQAKATLRLRENEELSAVFLGSHDEMTRTLPSPDPARTRAEDTTSTFHRGYVHYTHTLEDGSQVVVTPFVGYDQSSYGAFFGATPARLQVDSTKYGLRASHRARIFPRVSFGTGVDVLGSRTHVDRAGSLNIPPREGDLYVFGQPPGADYAVDRWSTHVLDVAPYVSGEVELGPFTVTPGLRYDAYLIDGSRTLPRFGDAPPVGFRRVETALAPRLAASYRWRDLTLNAAAGSYHQPPEGEELGPVFGTPDLILSRARHFTFGPTARVTPTLTVEATGFYKDLHDLVFRSRLPTPRVARALIQDGEGRSYGVQLLVRQQMWRGFFGWISYTLSRSERRYTGDATYRLFDYDQPHLLSLVASQTLGGWTFGARFRYATGLPRTPVAGAYYDARLDEYQPIFGAQNTIRLPDFYQLDLRIERELSIKKTKLLVYLDLLNVTFRENKEEIAYSHDFRQRGFIRGMPTVAVLGARLDL